jgi:hypothetical protein
VASSRTPTAVREDPAAVLIYAYLFRPATSACHSTTGFSVLSLVTTGSIWLKPLPDFVSRVPAVHLDVKTTRLIKVNDDPRRMLERLRKISHGCPPRSDRYQRGTRAISSPSQALSP